MNGLLFPTDLNTGGEFPPPRDFQIRAHEALRQGIRDGHRRQLLVAPTGGGKTYLGLRVCHEALMKAKRALFVCDRITLIDQTSKAADKYGLSAHGVIQGDHWRYDLEMPLQIASVQTLQSRTWPQADVIVVDEAHTRSAAWDHIPTLDGSVAVVGLTATPCSRGLGLLYTNLINAATLAELTKAGVLVPLRASVCIKPDMQGAATSGGEWTDKAAADREAQIVGDVITTWLEKGEGRKTIMFGATIDYCELAVQRFKAAGVEAATFTSRTSAKAREFLLEQFKEGAVKVLVSVEALAKGFDVPDVGCVIDCRPLRKSISTWIQMIGRGLRSSPETGKKDCILLDHSGNALRFQKDFEKIFQFGFTSLDMAEQMDSVVRKEEEAEKEPKACPQCGFTPFARTCMGCGFEKPLNVLEDTSAGEMRSISLGGQVAATDDFNLWQQCCAYARGHSKPENQRGRAYHLYRDFMGGEKPRWKFETTPSAPISKATLNQIKHHDIAWRKGQQKAKRQAQSGFDGFEPPLPGQSGHMREIRDE